MKIMSPSSTSLGKAAEDIAVRYLKKQGVKILQRNFHCRFGELDIIALDEQILSFVEVRYRKNETLLTAIETIDERKCRKLLKTSAFYLNFEKKYQSYQCRFDILTITGNLKQPHVEWIKNAFQA